MSKRGPKAIRNAKPSMRHVQILTTNRYEMFVLRIILNREIFEAIVREKKRMLDRDGWIPNLPILCRKLPGGKLEIIDGQHRFMAAKELGIWVWYTIVDEKYGVTPEQVNSPGNNRPWKLTDFVHSFLSAGHADYQELNSFVARHRVPVGIAASLLFGQNGSSGNAVRAIKAGTFKIKNKGYAEIVAGIVDQIVDIFPLIRGWRSVGSLSRCVSLKEFEPARFVAQCKKHSGMLRACATIEQYTALFEDIYNFHMSKKRIPLKFLADEAAKQRMVAIPLKRQLAQL